MPEYVKTYAMPAGEVEALLALGTTFEDARTAHDGTLSSWIERKRVERDGHLWVTLQERGQGYAADIEVGADGTIVAVVPLTPAAARELDE